MHIMSDDFRLYRVPNKIKIRFLETFLLGAGLIYQGTTALFHDDITPLPPEIGLGIMSLGSSICISASLLTIYQLCFHRN